ncbi:hypothetical protein EMCRGX_G001063 [Ephydatia muelleri]
METILGFLDQREPRTVMGKLMTTLAIHLDPNDFQTAIKCVLAWNRHFKDLPLSIAVDPLGHHSVTCKPGVVYLQTGAIPALHC